MSDQLNLTPVVLPKFLKPKHGIPLVRLGRAHDGGYLVDARTIDRADLLLSMGINDDWSFEAQFYDKNPVQIVAYDGSVSAWDFFIKFYTKVALFEPINAWNAAKIWLGFWRFFKPLGRTHHYNFIGNEGERRAITLDHVFEHHVPKTARRIFCKIDIEGSEYKILDTLTQQAERIEGLVIEFHDIDRNWTRLRRFLSCFPLNLCHIHANNAAPILDDATPVTIECSFSRNAPVDSEPLQFPNPLDSPCIAERRDLAISFSDR